MATVVRRLYYEGRPGLKQVKEEWFEVGGIREGPYRKYYPSGTLCQTGSYLHGKQHGEVRAYYQGDGTADGPIYMICTLVNGLREGEHTIFYMSGQVQKRSHYKDNVMVGTYELYTPDGIPIVPDERRVVMRTNMLAGNFEPFNL